VWPLQGHQVDNMSDQKQFTALDEDYVSALADGQLRGVAFAQAVEAVASDSGARAAWHTYHVVGDVLRSGAPQGAGDAAFLDRFKSRLALETAPYPVILPAAVTNVVAPVPVAFDATRLSANDGTFRWKLLAGVASAAAVAAIAWGSLAGGAGAPAAGPQLAQGEGPAAAWVQVASPAAQAPAEALQAVAVPGSTQVMIRDPRLDELLAAHKQAGGATALQTPSGFLRNATFEGPTR
jgi:sigma-E factor negative regulatory protein RseA